MLVGPQSRQCSVALITTIQYACRAPRQGSAALMTTIQYACKPPDKACSVALMTTIQYACRAPVKAVQWGSHDNYSVCL